MSGYIPQYKVGESVKLRNGKVVELEHFLNRTNEYLVDGKLIPAYEIVGFADA